MRSFILVVTLSLSAAAGVAQAAGGGSMPSPSSPAVRRAVTPEELALAAYNGGVRSIEDADEYLADAARQTDERKQQKAKTKAEHAYQAALRKFERATELTPRMPEAWNYLGYSNRKLGHYEAALSAYDRALSLKPDYVQAIEYRGHAYLGLNRLGDAKQAYLTLFGNNRQLAATLLVAMQEWIGQQRTVSTVDGTALDAFASWVRERGTIASQTAGLTREGVASSWR